MFFLCSYSLSILILIRSEPNLLHLVISCVGIDFAGHFFWRCDEIRLSLLPFHTFLLSLWSFLVFSLTSLQILSSNERCLRWCFFQIFVCFRFNCLQGSSMAFNWLHYVFHFFSKMKEKFHYLLAGTHFELFLLLFCSRNCCFDKNYWDSYIVEDSAKQSEERMFALKWLGYALYTS